MEVSSNFILFMILKNKIHSLTYIILVPRKPLENVYHSLDKMYHILDIPALNFQPHH